MADMAQRMAKLTPAQRKLLEQRLKSQPQVAQPIAVVGMACHLPGASNPDEYWQLIREGRVAVQEIPPERWDVNAFYDEDQDAPGKMATRWCALVDNFDQFDSLFFGIAPREASRMDPQQRLLLETSWEALENAGIAPDQLSGTATGVFVGIGGTDYSKLPSQFSNYHETIDAHVGTGNALSIAANRVSYILDLRGPSVAVDTACSSGFVALHQAIQELRNGTCDAALAGGVNMIISPEVTIAFSKARMLSPTGHCRPFDAAADGYVRGEGCAMVVLKRLTDALADGDNVLAVIRGTAVNQDGRTSGITAPNSLSQQACIRAALASAGLSTNDVSYIEAHGTGTPLGDPIEFQSLCKLFPQATDGAPDCFVSSVKANIGHTETVSGIAGLIKVILMMQHGKIPKQCELTELNPNISLDGTRLQIPLEEHDWPADRPRVAGVSSFGFGGTNTHVVVEAATPVVHEQNVSTERPQHVLTLSAKNKAALQDLATAYRERLATLTDADVADFCYSANTGRSHFNQRVAFLADTRDALVERLTTFAEGKKNAQVTIGEVRVTSRPRVAMLFTGQGSQYAGMGKGLYEQHPTVREIIDQCDSILAPILNKSIRQIILEDPESLINETAYTQPALFVIEYAVAKLWQSWGVEPSALLGHSVGEYVAACIAGVYSLETGLKLIAKRAELMQALPPNGMMAVIFAGRKRVEELLRPFGNAVTVATANGPENNVISGPTDLVEKAVAEFDKAGVGTQKLRVSHAFHSPLMDPMLDEFESFASKLEFGRPRIPIVANRTGKMIDTAEFNASYWRDHLRNCVEFADGIACIEQAGVDIYLEVGPAASLVGMGKRCAPESKAVWVSSLRKGRDDMKTLLAALCEVYVQGLKIDWRSFDAPWSRRRISLPNYPFQRSRHWLVGETGGKGSARGPSLHPLLGTEVGTALKSRIFEVRLSTDSPRYLKDHVVQSAVVVPAAAYLEQGLAASKLAFGEGNHAVENLAIQQGLFLPVEGARIAETIVAGESSGRASFEVHSCDAQADNREPKWQLHVAGSIVHESTLPDAELPELPDPEAFRNSAVHRLTHDEIYEVFADRALNYGPCFRVISEFARNHDQAIAVVKMDEIVKSKMDQYTIHPAIGDAMLQLTAGVIPLEKNLDHAPYTYVPMRIRSFRAYRPTQNNMWLYAVRTSADASPSPEIVEADVLLLTSDNEIIAEARGVTIQRIGRPINEEAQQDSSSWLHAIDWQKAESQLSDVAADAKLKDRGVVILGHMQGIAGALARNIQAGGGRAIVVQVGESFSGFVDSNGIATGEIAITDPDQYREMLETAVGQLGSEVTFIHAFALDAPPLNDASSVAKAIDCAGTSGLRLIQQLTRCQGIKKSSVWFVTRGGQEVVETDKVAVQQAPLWGFARVAALEAPDASCRIVDLDPDSETELQAAELIREIVANQDENQIAYRGGERFVARLVESEDSLNTTAASGSLTIPADSDYRLRIRSTGSFDGLYFEPFTPISPPAGKVEIEVRATGLNFSDVLKAMGLYPGITDAIVPLGIECAGVVCAVGPGVKRFKIGDEVMGIAPYSFASRAVTAEYALVVKPKNIDFQEAATIPITFLTAYYALVRLAQLQKNERVLIHAGAGGVGLAAIQIAKHIGAEIFATAGSKEKREFLTSLGVQHVMNSRTLEFAEEIQKITDRQGVDVVLNSLPGDAIEKSLDSMNAYGRFLEIGKTDIYANSKIGLLPFQDNLSYFAIDLDRMLRQRGSYVQAMFVEMMKWFESGSLQPLPFTLFSTTDTVNAFRYMAQRKNIGKIVVDMQAVDTAGEARETKEAIRDDATYVVTGGLGALGLQVAEQLVKDGAKFLALLSRRPPGDEAKSAIESLTQSGAQVVAIQGDVAELDSLNTALRQIPKSYPPLRGVIHAAGVLADGMLFDMELEQWNKPLASKVSGTWNLHQATKETPLDFFVMFSSVACVLGSPGQSNYAAGNAFLDGMAGFRTSQGLPATTINWGPWADSGMAAEAGRDTQISGRGMKLLPSEQSLELLSRLIRQQPRQVIVMSVDWAELVRAMGGKVMPLLRDVAAGVESGAEESSGEDRAFREALLNMPASDRKERLVGFFANQLAQIMGMEVSDVDVVSPLSSMGMDSLMAIELKNKIERRLQTALPMSVLIHEPSVHSLADYLASNFGGESEAAAESAVVDDKSVRTDEPNRVVGPHSHRKVPSDP